VLRGGPADKAGVKPGDVLIEVEGRPVADPTSMLNLIAGAAARQAGDRKDEAQRSGDRRRHHRRPAAEARRLARPNNLGQPPLLRQERLDLVAHLGDREQAVEVPAWYRRSRRVDHVALRAQPLRPLRDSSGGKMRSVFAGRNSTFALMRDCSFSRL